MCSFFGLSNVQSSKNSAVGISPSYVKLLSIVSLSLSTATSVSASSPKNNENDITDASARIRELSAAKKATSAKQTNPNDPLNLNSQVTQGKSGEASKGMPLGSKNLMDGYLSKRLNPLTIRKYKRETSIQTVISCLTERKKPKLRRTSSNDSLPTATNHDTQVERHEPVDKYG